MGAVILVKWRLRVLDVTLGPLRVLLFWRPLGQPWVELQIGRRPCPWNWFYWWVWEKNYVEVYRVEEEDETIWRERFV